ncbi:MAG: DUF6399 domain-containing protein, partial [bacterium]
AFWRTPEGQAYLHIMVVSIIYYCGICGGVGCETLELLFRALRLEQEVGLSKSSILRLKNQLCERIKKYGEEEKEKIAAQGLLNWIAGHDEIFFNQIPWLLMMELSSGFIGFEIEAKSRTYETWNDAVKKHLSWGNWNFLYGVSDGAQALLKLSREGLQCPSIPDLFHPLHSISKTLGNALARKVNKDADSTLLNVQQSYRQALSLLSEIVHPFNLSSGEVQTPDELPARFETPLKTLEKINQEQGTEKGTKAITAFRKLIPGFAQGVQVWWKWVLVQLNAQTPDIALQQCVIEALLPWIYWNQQVRRTTGAERKVPYQEAAQQAYLQLTQQAVFMNLSEEERQRWIDWGDMICRHYQRTSSAVEGRNGVLARFHHAGRGLSPLRLKALTTIHNFDSRRWDGLTPAERLSGQT